MRAKYLANSNRDERISAYNLLVKEIDLILDELIVANRYRDFAQITYCHNRLTVLRPQRVAALKGLK